MRILVFVIPALAIVATFVVAYLAYDKHCLTSDGKNRSFFLFILGMLFSGFAAGALIARFAIDPACDYAGCALVVGAIVQPYGWFIGMATFVYLWVKAKPTAKNNLYRK